MSTNSLRQSALCDRLISVRFEISWNLGSFEQSIPLVSFKLYGCATRGW